jgi:hypothetical protein
MLQTKTYKIAASAKYTFPVYAFIEAKVFEFPNKKYLNNTGNKEKRISRCVPGEETILLCKPVWIRIKFITVKVLKLEHS